MLRALCTTVFTTYRMLTANALFCSVSSMGQRQQRHRPAADLVIRGSEWWITGGERDGSAKLEDTEMVPDPHSRHDSEGVQRLPMPMEYHCIVSINRSHVFLAGGSSPDIKDLNQSFIIGLTNSEGWQDFDNMPIHRHTQVCFLLQTEFGKEIVVTGGSSA